MVTRSISSGFWGFAMALSSAPGSSGSVGRISGALPAPASEPLVERPVELQLPVEWFHDHFDTLWRLVARLGVPAHVIDDIVQEAFIAASRRRADVLPGHERRFLIGTALRLCSNYRQRASVRHEVSSSELLEQRASPMPDAEQLLMEKRLRRTLDEALASLSDAHRDVFVLYELEGFSVPEMAELLGLPIGTVSSRLGRARANFSRAAARLNERSKHPSGGP